MVNLHEKLTNDDEHYKEDEEEERENVFSNLISVHFARLLPNMTMMIDKTGQKQQG